MANEVVFADFDAEYSSDGSDCVFTDDIDVDEHIDDTDPPADPPPSCDIDCTFDRSVFDAVTGRVRFVGSRVIVDGIEIVLGRGPGFTLEESMTVNEQRSASFPICGDEWGIPSIEPARTDPSPCPISVPVTARRSPRSWGNKPVEVYVRLASSPAHVVERKVFQGMTSAKSNRGVIATTGEISALDDSMNVANVPLCLEIPPFSGLRRDEIVRLAAQAVGLDSRPPGSPALTDGGPTGQVVCPIGKVYNKPLQITNGSLVPFINDLGAGENWFAYFNENGYLVVERIEMKEDPVLPDWVIDADAGDFDIDSFEEEPPAQPATRIIVNLVQPVDGTGPGGAGVEQTTRVIREDWEFYAPQCVKVRPSGQTSYLYGDGSYRTIPVEQLMLVQKTITDVTTVNGKETRRSVTTLEIYNPLAADPNFVTYPTGTSYDGAYGDKSFHRDEAESLMEVSYDSLETTRDSAGTPLSTVETSKAWYAPHRGLTFDASGPHVRVKADTGATPPSYIYAGGTARTLPAEDYLVVSKVETVFEYGSDGTLASKLETTSGWFSPESRCDISVNDDDPTDQIPEDPPFDNPPPNPPPSTSPAFHPSLQGPLQGAFAPVGGVFTFSMSISGAEAPTGGGALAFYATPLSAPPPTYGTRLGTPIGHVLSQPFSFDPVTAPVGYATVQFSGPKPVLGGGLPYVIYGVFSVGIAGRTYWSNTVVFDPWADVPPGGSL